MSIRCLFTPYSLPIHCLFTAQYPREKSSNGKGAENRVVCDQKRHRVTEEGAMHDEKGCRVAARRVNA
jgi:hypothetical protein